ncbi:MAG: hypothetical protein KBA46_00590 [Candidatus Omnitrophica bacterium]|nr:hypothetical protein [Candidatus Omnitrophota bacterium]
MEVKLKNRLSLVFMLTTVIFFLGTVGSCMKLARLSDSRMKEMATRLDVEEKLSLVLKDKAAFEEKAKKLSVELDEVKADLESTKKTLRQEQLVGASLREEFDKIKKRKDLLEIEVKQLKEAQEADKISKSKK